MNTNKKAVKKPKKEEQYEKIINRMQRDIEKLKSKNESLEQQLEENAKYMIEVAKDKTIQEIFQEVLDNTDVNVKDKCPKCNTTNMKKINFGHVKVVICQCGYRNRVNESRISTP